MENGDDSVESTTPFYFRGKNLFFHWLAGVVLPIFPILASLATDRGGPTNEFQYENPDLSYYASAFLGSEVSWMFAPFFFVSMACFFAVLLNWEHGRFWFVRLGVYAGAFLGMIFSVAIGLSLGDYSLSLGFTSFSLSISKAWFAPLVVAFFFGIYFLQHGLKRRHRHAHWVMWLVLLGLPFVGSVVRADFGAGMVFYLAAMFFLLFVIAFAAPLVVLSYGLMGWFLIRTHELAKPMHSALGALAWLSGLGVTLQVAFRRSVEVYESLPPPHSSCYVATAAARGSRWFVGSCENGANDQLRLLKAWEILLELAFPAFHRFLRKSYDCAGPPLAKIIAKRVWLANCAYLFLKPAEFAARLTLGALCEDGISLAKRLYRNR